MPRKYELKKRAESQAATRQRIVEAIAKLHSEVGPARTTVSAIAELANVERLTVYRHFPTEASMFEACGLHWRRLHPRPNTEVWMQIPEPRQRLKLALDQLYQFYEETEGMSRNILRDEAVLPDLVRVANFHGWLEIATDRICAAWPNEEQNLVRPAVRLAFDLNTWQLLVRQMGVQPELARELVLKLL